MDEHPALLAAEESVDAILQAAGRAKEQLQAARRWEVVFPVGSPRFLAEELRLALDELAAGVAQHEAQRLLSRSRVLCASLAVALGSPGPGGQG